MAELDDSKRAIILQYRFVDQLPYIVIATKVPGVTANAARMFCTRTRARARSSQIDDLLEHLHSKARSGAPRRVPPGSQAALRIREQLRGAMKFQDQTEAANRVYHKQRNKDDHHPL